MLETESHPLLSIKDIHKQFGYKQVLKGVSLDLPVGQTTLLAGKNGAGKSTLIKILSGLMQPSAGKIYFSGAPLAEQANEYRNSFGLITHQSLFYNDLTARENLIFFAKLRKIDQIKDKIAKVLAVTGLEKAGDLPVKAFSSGMGQRLNIARVMIAQPKILFLDEPYSGLDLDSINMLNAYLDTFKEKRGAILLISHQIDACYDSCDQVALLVNGFISRVIPTAELNRLDLVQQFQNDNYE